MALWLTSCFAAADSNGSSDRTGRWQEDLDFFARELPLRQRDFSRLLPKDKFDRSVAELKTQLPHLSDPEIVFELMRVVASLRVAHTTVLFGSAIQAVGLHGYPLRLQWFSDKLAVVAAAAEYREAIGCRVVRMGAVTSGQVEAAVAPYIPRENDTRLHCESPRYMTLMELLQRENVVGPGGRLQLTCAKSDGKEFTIELAPARVVDARRNLIEAADALRIPGELCRKWPEAHYWYEFLPETGTLYIQYSKCAEDTNNPFAEFTRKLFVCADAQPVQRVVVDLRFNAGGKAGVVKPLVEGLKSRPALIAQGHLCLLIGPQTFSSAMFAAMDFRDGLHATVIGEPTGNKPNHYGEAQSFVLPNSRLRVQYSTKHFQLIRNADPTTLEPDIVVTRSLADFLAGRDRVLDAAIQQSHPFR